MKEKITLEKIKNDKDFRALIDTANGNLEQMGYTEHGLRHVGYVSKTTANILSALGYDERTVELGAITGWIHDIGNSVNRQNHGITGSILAFDLLNKMGMEMHEIGIIVGAIGNHEEQNGTPISAVSAALIIADKSDAHRSRVRKKNFNPKDIHDRVNMSITKNYLAIDVDKKVIRLVLFMDNKVSSFMEYLEIYLSRMVLSEKAATYLGYNFELVINNTIINNRKNAMLIPYEKGNEKEVSED